ncbi:MAG: hypothetical protein QM778_39085 [Myxococcales bacterium]
MRSRFAASLSGLLLVAAGAAACGESAPPRAREEMSSTGDGDSTADSGDGDDSEVGDGDGDGDQRPGTGDGDADGGAAASEAGCGETKLRPVPEDTSVRGPWKVGVRTATVGRLKVEVFYPAKPGTTDGKPVAKYDIRDWLPQQERKKIPDANVPLVTAIGGDVYRDVPIDDEFGPYPVVMFVHGTSSFRIASGTLNAQWASRGFVVVAADYPGLGLKDQLSATLECSLPHDDQDIPGDVDLQLDALKSASGDLAFLKDHLDMTRLAVSGHSQGGCVSSTFTALPGVRIVMPLSGSTVTTTSDTLESILYVSGIDDRVMGYAGPWVGSVVCPLGSISAKSAYEGSPGKPKIKKRLLGVKTAGHLLPTDLCQKNDQGKNAIEEAQADGVCGIGSAVIIGLPYLFDCATIDMAKGLNIVGDATTAALEETLHCRNRNAAFAALKGKLPAESEFIEDMASP